jgi:hypothetical protein
MMIDVIVLSILNVLQTIVFQTNVHQTVIQHKQMAHIMIIAFAHLIQSVHQDTVMQVFVNHHALHLIPLDHS